MVPVQFVVRLGGSPRNPALRQRTIVASLTDGIFVETVEAGGIGHQYHRFVHSLQFQLSRRIALYLPVLCQYLDQGTKMDAPIRVVQMLFRHVIVVNRIGMIGRIAFGRNFVVPGRGGVRQLGVEREQGPDAFRTLRTQTDDDDRVRGRSEIIAGEVLPVPQIAGTGYGRADIQRAPVGRNCSRRIQIGDGQLSQRLIVLTVVSLYLPLFLVGTAVVFPIQFFTDYGDGQMGIGSGHLAVRLAGP